MHAERRTTVYTLESQSEIDPEPVAFEDELFLQLIIEKRRPSRRTFIIQCTV